MVQKKEENFTVTDRRLFTSEGELRKDVPEESQPEITTAPATAPEAVATQASREPQATVEPETLAEPQAPSASEQKEQADAYQKLSQEMDREVELGGHSAKELEITFERFLASLYMNGMLQLGLMREQGASPQLDLIGARQSIDSLALLSEKTKGNLSPKEENFLQNALYELRMAYVEVTNAIAKGPQQVPAVK